MRAARLLRISQVLLCASCSTRTDVDIRTVHHNSPYDDDETQAHTLDFACAYLDATGRVPRIRSVNVYWKDSVRAPDPVGGLRTDNGIHVAHDVSIEASALWHELAHVALGAEGDADEGHTQAEVWDMVETRHAPFSD